MKNYDEIDMQQASQADADKHEVDGMNLYCLIGMIFSISGTLILFPFFLLGLCVSIAGITLSAVGLYMHNRGRRNLSGKTFGKVGIIVPIVGIVIYVIAIILIFIWVNNSINPTLGDTTNDSSNGSFTYDGTSWTENSTSSPSTVISRDSSESITISEILNSRAQGQGVTQIYKTHVSRLDGLKLSEIGKDTRVEAWNYDGQSVSQIINSIPLGDIAGKDYVAPIGVSDGHDVAFNIVTDSSGNNTVYEELCDKNDNVKFLFGAPDGLSYCTPITVYGTTYLCFIETMYEGNNYVAGDIIFIEDKDDTQNKNIAFDTVGTKGITVDGK